MFFNYGRRTYIKGDAKEWRKMDTSSKRSYETFRKIKIKISGKKINKNYNNIFHSGLCYINIILCYCNL